MGIVRRARLKEKPDMDIEVHYNTEDELYVMIFDDGTTKRAASIPRATFQDTKKVCKFLMKHCKAMYNCI